MAFVKKEVDIAALMAMAEADAAEEANGPSPRKKKKEKKPKKEKVKKEKTKKPKKDKADKTKSRSRKNKSKKGKRAPSFGVAPAYEGEDEDELPKVFADLISILEDQGTEHEGLFRKTASTTAVEDLIVRYEDGEDIEWGELEDFHLVGGVLMAYLLRLPEPLINFEQYDVIMRYHANAGTDKEALCRGLKKAIDALPEINFEMLDTLLDFLDTMTRDAEESLMHADNLAICFGPALMHRREENLGQLMKESQLVTDTITLLIEHFGFFFRDEPLNLDQAKSGTSASLEEEAPTVDLKEFGDKAKEGLEDVNGRLLKVLGELEFAKLWNEESASYLAVIIHLLEQSLQQATLDADSIRQAVRSQFNKHNGMAKAQGVELYCAGLKNKLGTVQSAISEQVYKLDQSGISQTDVLTALAISKSSKAVMDELGSQILHESAATAKDMNLIITLGPILCKQIAQLKQTLDTSTDVGKAVVVSRVVRAGQKALKERIQTPLEGADLTPGAPSGSAAKDKRKIETLQDTLEFCFPAMKKIVTGIEAEAQDPSKQSDTVRNAQLFLSLYNFFYAHAPVQAPPGLVGVMKSNAPPPAAPHPSQSGPPPVAPHPSAKGPPPSAPHPSQKSGPPPVAPHPSQKGPAPVEPHPSKKAPPPAAPHPASRGAPPPVAAHPRAAAPATAPHPSAAPPPVAAHPRSKSPVGAPPPIAAHPRSSGGAPPPIAAHPRSGSPAVPPPIAAHPAAGGQPPRPGAPPPKKPPAGWIPAARPIKPRPHDQQ